MNCYYSTNLDFGLNALTLISIIRLSGYDEYNKTNTVFKSNIYYLTQVYWVPVIYTRNL